MSDAPPGWVRVLLLAEGVGLLALAIAGFAFNGSAFATALDLSPLEDGIHLALALVLLYTGLSRPTRAAAVAALAFVGAIAFAVGVLGPTPVVDLFPSYLTDRGVVDGSWGHAHHAFHLIGGIVNLGVAVVVGRQRPSVHQPGRTEHAPPSTASAAE